MSTCAADLKYRLEDLLTSYYRVEKIDHINYHQFVPKKPDDQWSIQAELLLRKQNPRVLVALFSRELWCFSINENPIPITQLDNSSEPLTPDKSGQFKPDFSKPNLPTPYAIFLKAMRRMLNVNLCLESNNGLLPFGNSCVYQQNAKSNKIVHLEPHLFENGDLLISICIKDLPFNKLPTRFLNDSFLKLNAVYLAPSGIRVYLPSSDLNKCLSPPPKNSNVLLLTLLVSHGIDLTQKKDLKWISLIPNLNHLNGYTPVISKYLDHPKATKTIIWPLDLCFAQSATDSSDIPINTSIDSNLLDSFDVIDDFIQLKLTSAYRIPGSSGPATGGATGNNPMSTGGIYTDQFQSFHRHLPAAGLNAPSSVTSTNNLKFSPNGSPGTGLTPGNGHRTAPSSTDNFGTGFMTTPNINEHVDPMIDDIVIDPPSIKDQSELWNERKDSSSNTDVNSNREGRAPSVTLAIESEGNDVDFDKDLFGEEDEDDEDLFGEKEKSRNDAEHEVKEITDEMFDMAENSDTGDDKITPSGQSSFPAVQQTSLKRKYLDIPLDEITLPATPLYTDPGAPLPVETPKERRRSVFAPLNFNPIIESNVDNKYKNGGKFSFNTNQSEESLKFDVSTTNISSSEDDESEYSGEDFEDDSTVGNQAMRSVDISIPLVNYASDSENRNMTEFMQPDSIKEDSLMPSYQNNDVINLEKVNRENQLDQIWKSPTDITQDNSPSKISPSLAIAKSGVEGSVGLEPGGNANYNNTTAFFEQTPAFSSDDRIAIVNKSHEFTSEEQNDSNGIVTSAASTIPESSNSLPFLLRHMPLFSIPDVFLSKNPILPEGNDLQDLLDVLCEQVVFDQGMLGDLGIKKIPYRGIRGCHDGIIKRTFGKLFSNFTRLHGNEVIDDFFHMKQPSVYVKKHHETIKIKSDAENFLNYLHLKPYKGIKNFKSLFLTTSFKDDCIEFLSIMSQTFASQELGFCELVRLTNEDTQGLIYLKNFNKDTLLLLSAQIVSYCSTNMSSAKNVPLLIFLPLKSSALEDVISMCLKFHLIKNEVQSKLPNATLLLKLIPLEFITNPLTSVDDYNDLCIGVYNILPPKHLKFTSIAEQLPEKIEFRTAQQPNGQNIHYDTYIHLAYTRSIDREWLCASWSDSQGKENSVKTWYIGNSKTKFQEICDEIWRVTMKFISNKPGRICLVLTRLDSVLPDDELMHWRRLSSSTRNLHLAVVCVGDNTKVSFYDEDKMYPSFKPLLLDESLSERIDLKNLDDYEVVNIDKEVHGAIFHSPLQLANSQHRCAIKSGALMKFKKSSGNDMIDKFEVNLLNCPHSDSAKLLKIILQQFRNLSSLNAWFGVSKDEESHIPWHVLSVKKMMNVIVHARVNELPQ